MPRVLLKIEICDTHAAFANLEKVGDGYWRPRERGRAQTDAEQMAIMLDHGRRDGKRSDGLPDAPFYIEWFGAWWAERHDGGLPAVVECRTFFDSEARNWICHFVVDGVVYTPSGQGEFVVAP